MTPQSPAAPREEQISIPFEGSIELAFQRDLAERPQVYAKLLEITFQLKRQGFEHYSIDEICHRVRWHFKVEKLEGETFKMNNNFTSRYARKIIADHPELHGFFELRQLKS